MAKIFFTSDLHLGHRQIARRRCFDSVDDMDGTLIRNINATVTAHDELWILGDFSYRISKDEAKYWLKQIRCRHVHLIRGNHDKDWSASDGWASVDDYVEFRGPDRQLRTPLFHYPLRAWNGQLRGAFHLYGHMHSTEAMNVQNVVDGLRCYDVGVDANDMHPITLDKIIERITTVEDMLKEGFTANDLRDAPRELKFPD